MQDILTERQVARLAGISLGTLRVWRYARTYKRVPEPDIKGEAKTSTPYWYPETIENWLPTVTDGRRKAET